LLLLQVLFSGSLEFVAGHPRLVPAITLASALQVALAAVLMVTLSSLSRSRRFAAMLYAGLVIFAAAIARLLQASTGSPAWVLLSPESTLLVVNDAMFGDLSDSTVPVALAMVALTAVLIACIAILERRVRAVDVVA
jgi:hypothetical protein